MKNLLMALSLLLVTTAAMAVPAKPGLWRTITLSNGTQVRVTGCRTLRALAM